MSKSITLIASVESLKGIGKALAGLLGKLGINTVQDLLFHLPFRYVDKTSVTPISMALPGKTLQLQGEVTSSQVLFGRRRSLKVHIHDGTGQLGLRFFHFNASQQSRMAKGALLRVFGEVKLGQQGLEIFHPETQVINSFDDVGTSEKLTPIYPLTEGLGQTRLRAQVKLAFDAIQQNRHAIEDLLADELPEHLARRFYQGSISDALEFIHFPPPDTDIAQILAGTHPIQQRLAFEEMLAHFLVRWQMRDQAQRERAPHVSLAPQMLSPSEQAISKNLPFTLTGAQQKVLREIRGDYSLGKPMLRMVQGDVGSGKTLVAMMACARIVDEGFQAVIVAPTEILAEQHFIQARKLLEPIGLSVEFLVGKLTAKNKREAKARLASGEAQVTVGTHALFEDDVQFAKLGLAVVDEQHKFGVHQRLSLRSKSLDGNTPHQLVMTATPIPRTLAMTAYSELDLSVIDELPPGRTPINTVLVSRTRKAQVIERIRDACAQGTQAYWVCPLVEESETLQLANAEESYQQLQAALNNLKVGLVHGRMKPAEKEAVMSAFKKQEIDCLVATTVIEVGVDVPNASLMIIENPERMGLAQLHQIRGRVGRGAAASHCVLLYGDELSRQGKERLNALKESTDGFFIAEKDLELRGPGELLGTRQTGEMQYRMADPVRDRAIIPDVHALGKRLYVSKPEKVEKILSRWFGSNRVYTRV